VNDGLIAAFDGLFEALLERSDAEEAIGLFTDGDVMFWGSGRAEQALGRRALAELFGQIAEIGDVLTFEWDERQANVRGDAVGERDRELHLRANRRVPQRRAVPADRSVRAP